MWVTVGTRTFRLGGRIYRDVWVDTILLSVVHVGGGGVRGGGGERRRFNK